MYRRLQIRIVITLFRVNISYRRILTVDQRTLAVNIPPYNAGWTQLNSFSANYGRTFVVIGLKSFPISPQILKIFMPKQMFSLKEPGLALMVPNWMAFNTEIDSHIASWRHKKTRRGSNIFALS